MATLRNLKIKASTCKRIVKELHSYEEEVKREAAKTADMKANGADPYDLKQQENVLTESRMMVPDCRKRLVAALSDLKDTLAELEESGKNEGPEIDDARSTIAEKIAKREAKGNGKLRSTSDHPMLGDAIRQINEFNEAKKAEAQAKEKMAEAKRIAAEAKLIAAEAKGQMAEAKSRATLIQECEFVVRDISTMTDKQLEAHDRACAQIYAKWASNNN